MHLAPAFRGHPMSPSQRVFVLAFVVSCLALGPMQAFADPCIGELAGEAQFAKFTLSEDRTMLAYMQSFGVSASSESGCDESWSSGHAVEALTIMCTTGTNYFQTGNVAVIQSDNQCNGDDDDWAVFNFSPLGHDNFAGDETASDESFFGGEEKYSGGAGGAGFAVGKVWGLANGQWKELYSLPLDDNYPFANIFGQEMANNAKGSWFVSGGGLPTTSVPYGKRPEYDTLEISEVGFSVSTEVHDPCDGKPGRLTNKGCLEYCTASWPTEEQVTTFALARPTTLLEYMQSFGVAADDLYTCGAGDAWATGHAVAALEFRCLNDVPAYFTTGNVAVIQSDNHCNGDDDDWAVFNFSPLGHDNFAGDETASDESFFGGEEKYSGGAGGAGFTVGKVWGLANGQWKELYSLPLDDNYPFANMFSPDMAIHAKGSWFTTGGGMPTTEAPYGKRPEYDSLVISAVAFSVSTDVPDPCDGKPGRLTNKGCLEYCTASWPTEEQVTTFALARPTTLLEYMQSFEVAADDLYTCGAGDAWATGHAVAALEFRCLNDVPAYFTTGNVAVIQSDNHCNGDDDDWAVFNFSPLGHDNFAGDETASDESFFGGEEKYSGGAGGAGFTVGKVWGLANGQWKELYSLPLDDNYPFANIFSPDMAIHAKGSWFTTGGGMPTTEAPYGKRPEYDSLVISAVAFSVSTDVPDPCGSSAGRLTNRGCVEVCAGDFASEEHFEYFELADTSTLLEYMQQFGVSGEDETDCTPIWAAGVRTEPLTTACMNDGPQYFRTGAVTMIQSDGDCNSDKDDWVVFNFGPDNHNNFDDSEVARDEPFFGGEEEYSGGAGKGGHVVGKVWGRTPLDERRSGGEWVELYAVPLASNFLPTFSMFDAGIANHREGGWFTAGGTVPTTGSPFGKRPEYDSLNITAVGFSVSRAMPADPCTDPDDLFTPSLQGCTCTVAEARPVSDTCHCLFTMEYNAAKDACVCPPGYYDDGSGQCLGTCPSETLPGQEGDAVLYLRATAKDFVVVDKEFSSTLLEYLQGLTAEVPVSSWLKENTAAWADGHDTLPIADASSCYVEPSRDPYLHSGGGRVKVLQSDVADDDDLDDYAVFNFGVDHANLDSGYNNFEGRYRELAYFGGEVIGAGLLGYSSDAVYGSIWGFNDAEGWAPLYVLPLTTSGAKDEFSNANGNWHTAGGAVTSGFGKRAAYDTMSITRLGFAISSMPVTPLTVPGPVCDPLCPANAICAATGNASAPFACECSSGFKATTDGAGCVDTNECVDDDKTGHCDHLAYCVNTPGSYECECPEGFLGDGFSCSNSAWSLRTVLQFAESQNGQEETLRLQYGRALLGATVSDDEPLIETLHVRVVDVQQGTLVTLNALFPSMALAQQALDELDLSRIDWELLGATFEEVVDGPDLYAWVGRSTSDPIAIQPSGFELQSVHFSPSCLNSGCWVLDVIYTTGTADFNAFYLPKAEAADDTSFDPVYTTAEPKWEQSPADTFFPNTHPCTSADFEATAGESLSAAVSSCCLPHFVDMYRPTKTFAAALETGVLETTDWLADCGEGVRDRLVNKTAITELAYGDLTAPGVMGGKGVFVDGVFAGMNVSYGRHAGVIDPYVGIYKAKFFLDEVELRTLAGQRRGTVGVEHTVDTFLGLINLSPTGTKVLDSFATQANIHLEKTDIFTVSTHGTNDYTFLEYVNLRLVAIYNEDTDFSGTDESALQTVRTISTGAAHYVQVTFTLGSKYGVNANSGLIPLDSVRAGKGTFFADNLMAHKCDQYTTGTLPNVVPFNASLEQPCAPSAAMCVSPSSIPDSFVSFNIPLGVDFFGAAASDLSNNVFVAMVISAVDTEARGDQMEPNSGEAPWQMKTTLTASIPVVDGGVNIFCDGFTAKTDLQDVANVDIIVGSASDSDELTRLRILRDVASTQLDTTAPTQIDSDSIEAGLMTLVLKGNASYFDLTGQSGTTMELEDVISVHIMESDGSGQDASVAASVLGLIQQPPDDNSNASGLLTDGYCLSGAVCFEIDRSAQRAHLEPTAALLALCPFNPTRPQPGNTPLETCVTRRDVRYRGFPARAGGESTAMEICGVSGQSCAEELSGQYTPGMAWASMRAESKFMATLLGASDFAHQLALDFAEVVDAAYGLNDRYRRAYWINPGYEWTPTQTGGTPLFSVSQKLFVLALVTLDENIASDPGATAPSLSFRAPSSVRRMLLTAEESLQEASASASSVGVEFDTSPRKLMAQTFKVDLDRVVVLDVQLQLTQTEACLSPSELQAALRDTLDDYLSGAASAYETVQVVSMAVDRGDEECGGRRQQGAFSSATARVSMLVVFAADVDPTLSTAQLLSMPGIQSIETPDGLPDTVTISDTFTPRNTDTSSSSSSSTAIIAGVSGGVGALVLMAIAAVLYTRRSSSQPPQIPVSIEVSQLKASLAEDV